MVDEEPGRLTRREVLWGSAASALVLLGGCGRGSSTTAAATPPVTFDPEDAPVVEGLGEMQPEYVEDARTFLVAVPPALRARVRALLPPEVHEGIDAGLLGASPTSAPPTGSSCASARPPAGTTAPPAGRCSTSSADTAPARHRGA